VARERVVNEAIRALRITRVIVIVAHRPETIASADRVIKIGPGSVQSLGTVQGKQGADSRTAMLPTA
jgi:ABC-type multidrug transport system fused ATPase/permease subunit